MTDKTISQEQMDQIRKNMELVRDNNNMTEKELVLMTMGVIVALGDTAPTGWQLAACAARPLVDSKNRRGRPGRYELRSDRSRDTVLVDVDCGEDPLEMALYHLGYTLSKAPVTVEEDDGEDY